MCSQHYTNTCSMSRARQRRAGRSCSTVVVRRGFDTAAKSIVTCARTSSPAGNASASASAPGPTDARHAARSPKRPKGRAAEPAHGQPGHASLRTRLLGCRDHDVDHLVARDAELRVGAEDLLDRRPEARRSAGAARRRLGDRLPHGSHRWSGRAVGPLERRLEAGAQAVVAEAEETHLVDVRVAGGSADEIAVDRGLGQLVRDGDVLSPLVAREPRGVDLPPDFVEVESSGRSASSAERCRRTRPRAPA